MSRSYWRPTPPTIYRWVASVSYSTTVLDIHGRPRLELIAVMRQLGFNFIQAPYEAGSQLVQCWIDNPKIVFLANDDVATPTALVWGISGPCPG